MRSEETMIELILKVAKEDTRIRAVGMNGSRINPQVRKDFFRDYDIVYLVTDMESFINNRNWIDVFGDRIIMQTPDESVLFPSESLNRFAYLMLFTDGNRIDLTLVPIQEKEKYCNEDSLIKILLDKDGTMPEVQPPSDHHYWVKRPSADTFADCCIEFWWVSTYVAKGLWRREVLYAQDHMDICRKMLLMMLEWQVGMEHGFSVSIGKSRKFLEHFVAEDTWSRLLQTYTDGRYENVWEALFSMMDLFRETSLTVSAANRYFYPLEEDQRVTQYIAQVRNLPSNAQNL